MIIEARLGRSVWGGLTTVMKEKPTGTHTASLAADSIRLLAKSHSWIHTVFQLLCMDSTFYILLCRKARHHHSIFLLKPYQMFLKQHFVVFKPLQFWILI